MLVSPSPSKFYLHFCIVCCIQYLLSLLSCFMDLSASLYKCQTNLQRGTKLNVVISILCCLDSFSRSSNPTWSKREENLRRWYACYGFMSTYQNFFKLLCSTSLPTILFLLLLIQLAGFSAPKRMTAQNAEKLFSILVTMLSLSIGASLQCHCSITSQSLKKLSRTSV